MFPLILNDELHISYKKPSLRTTSTFLLISEMIEKILLLLLIVLLTACLPVKCMQEEKTISKKLLLDEITTDLSEKGVKCLVYFQDTLENSPELHLPVINMKLNQIR